MYRQSSERPRTRRGRTPLALLASTLLVPACGDAPAPGADTPTTPPPLVAQSNDSAGITIRTTPAAALERTAYRRSPTPALYLDGTADGGEPFHAIGALAFSPSGEIAIAERGEMRVRIHGPDGRRLRTVGREGEGPGEFGALNGLGFRGDSLFVFDSRWFRISVFDGDGTYVRQVEPRGDWGTRYRWVSLAPEVGILTRAQRRGADLLWGLHDFAGDPIHPLPNLPASPTPTMARLRPAGDLSGPIEPLQLFGSRPGAGPFAGGFASFMGEPYEVHIHTRDGTASEIWRVAGEGNRPVTDDDVEAAHQRALDTADPERHPMIERMWSNVEVPERFPALGSAQGFVYTAPPEILESAAGELWVHGYPTGPESPRLWWVFAPDGTLRGSVSFPPRFELHAVGAAGALGIELDDFDVERVALYALELPE